MLAGWKLVIMSFKSGVADSLQVIYTSGDFSNFEEDKMHFHEKNLDTKHREKVSTVLAAHIL